MTRFLLLSLVFWLLPTTHMVAQPTINSPALLSHVEELASDSYGGREAGTPGNEKARNYIERHYTRLGLAKFEDSYRSSFTGGQNVIGYAPGTEDAETYVIVTAHFDHLGTRNGQIYNGADDNASGTAALLEMAAYFKKHPPKHSIIFAALDAEEKGLKGARAFVAKPPIPAEHFALIINMDMISNNNKRELYAAGTYHYPFLKPYLKTAARSSDIELLFGHDKPNAGQQDWTYSSDHGPFHAEWNLPFIYFGVEDHPHYHKPTDDYDTINHDFFVGAVETILAALIEFDSNLVEIMAQP